MLLFFFHSISSIKILDKEMCIILRSDRFPDLATLITTAKMCKNSGDISTRKKHCTS